MKTEIVITNNFQKEAKKYLKKYKSLKVELEKLHVQLRDNPKSGVSLGNNSYKIRLKVKSKGKGKSGGLRIITHFEMDVVFDGISNRVYLLSIYDKSETGSIDNNQILKILKGLKLN